ncbi:MAG: four helix bundle protein [Prevotella sp.]|nr:four helix bundle protein [Prevotella sp.]
MNNHKNLIVWQKSMEFVTAIYVVTKTFPKEEFFGIVSQMRRAAISIPSNIAEGYGRVYDKETSKFLSIALGSASEIETQLIISKNLDYIDVQEAQKLIEQIEEIIRMLTALIKSRSI